MDDRSLSEAQGRLRRIAGQVGGIQRMLDEGRYCVDVLLQIAAVQAALAQVGRVILTAHVETCLVDAIRSGNEEDRHEKLDELVRVFFRFCGTRGELEGACLPHDSGGAA